MLFRIALCVVLSTLLASAHGAGAQDKPHILYITMDDLGWKDVGYHGGTIQTPNIDTLAQHGLRLEKFYVQPFSGQTRAAAMTGRYPMRYGFQTLSPQPFSTYGLPTDERTLPRALKDAGYRTALIGKWHLGHAKPEYWPTQRGFDYHYGSLMGEADYFKKTASDGTPDWRRNSKPVKESGYATSLLGKEAVSFIGKHDPNMPLFMHLSFSAPQAPYQAPKDYLDRYSTITDEGLRAYSAMITAVDDQIG
ncbi:MAG: sulfatase-like hydrolase/transferase, partial [Burkholderiales bacterium]